MGYNNKLRAEAWVCSVANWDTTARETGQTGIATSVLDKLGHHCAGLVITQKMSQHTFIFFLLYICDLHNMLELKKL